MPRAHAVVPLKDVPRAKSRLAGALGESQRLRLIGTMLDHVVQTAAHAPGIGAVSVLTRDPAWVPRGAVHLPDDGDELNAALAGAARMLRSSGADVLLIVAADLPLVTADDLGALVAASRGAIAAAPDWTDTGTNALAVPLARNVPTRFGPGSLAAHRSVAQAAQLPWAIVRRPGLAFDVDEPSQLEFLARSGGERYAFLTAARGPRREPT